MLGWGFFLMGASFFALYVWFTLWIIFDQNRKQREEGTKRSNMCLSGAMYYDEDEYDDEEFYNKNSKDWDYYSGLPNPKAYENK